jgi:hypothetical protein
MRSSWTTQTSGTCIRHVGVDVVGADIEIRSYLALDGCRVPLLFRLHEVIVGLSSQSVGLGLLTRRGDLARPRVITMFQGLLAQLFGLLFGPTLRQEDNDGHDNGNNDDDHNNVHAVSLPDPTLL